MFCETARDIVLLFLNLTIGKSSSSQAEERFLEKTGRPFNFPAKISIK
jgi:hypothetical protein